MLLAALKPSEEGKEEEVVEGCNDLMLLAALKLSFCLFCFCFCCNDLMLLAALKHNFQIAV